MVVLVFAAPVSLSFELRRRDGTRGHAQLRVLYGLVRKRFEWGGDERESAEASSRRQERRGRTPRKAPKKKQRKPRSSAHVLEALQTPGLWASFERLLRRLVRAVRFGRWSARMRFGLADPADTGLLWGLLGPLALVAQHVRGADLELGPVFDDECLHFDAEGSVAIVPLELLAVVVAFAVSPSTLRAGYTMLKRGKR